MTSRFRHSVQIPPGVRMDVDNPVQGIRSGDVRYVLDRQTTIANVGFPESGVCYRPRDGLDHDAGMQEIERIDRQHEKRLALLEDEWHIQMGLYPDSLRLSLLARGNLDGFDEDGNPLDPTKKTFRDSHADDIRAWLEIQAHLINCNSDIDFRTIHLDMPAPVVEPDGEVPPFEIPPHPRKLPPEPVRRDVPKPGILLGLPWVRRRYHAALAAAEEQHRRALDRYRKDFLGNRRPLRRLSPHPVRNITPRDYYARLFVRQEAFARQLRTDIVLMGQILDTALLGLDWPCDMLVSHELQDAGRKIWIDIELPGISDMPQEEARVAANGRRLIIAERSLESRWHDYARYVHALLLRVIGYAFATLPSLQEVAASGYRRSRESAARAMADEYLISVRADLATFGGLDFAGLETLDPVEAIERFELRRSMPAIGMFMPIEPFGPAPGPAPAG